MKSFNIQGACHCGNISLRLQWPDDALVPVRCCSCGFCRKHGGEWTSHPDAELAIEIGSRRHLSRYRFGTETADFLICSRCGVAPAAVSTIGDRDYAVVNVRTLELDEALKAAPQASDFDAENASQRLDRRRRNWIGGVALAVAGKT